ncbi:MAG: hypothetical protein M1815_001809 [Lichina confinis]|nr:MAG: hypothetical protein M1815_001809 [Lichina confinis]
MLKAANLNALLSQNTSAHIADIFIFTPQGTLIAYSASASPMTLRMHATLAASVWSSYASLASNGTVAAALPGEPEVSSGNPPDTRSTEPTADSITYLTLDLADGTLLITALACGLLLCLVGSVSRQGHSRARSAGSSPPPPPQHASLPNGASLSIPSETGSSGSGGSSLAKAVQVLAAHDMPARINQSLRTKAETLASWLNTELASFRMPGPT